jgi:putative endonuclease
MYFVYILKCADGSLYTGSTNNLPKRLKDHNESKRGAKYTKSRRPVKLIYQYRTVGKALRRENEIKSWPRPKKLLLLNSGKK